MDFVYGTSDFDQSRGNLIQLPVVNMYAESAPSEQNTVLLSRPAISSTGITAMGSGPVTTLFQMDGVLSGNFYGISGGKLYQGSILIGTMDGTDRGTICCFPTRIFANQGGNIFTYDGTTFASVTTPGSFLTTDICVGGDRLIALQAGTGIVWWSDILSTNINGLSFATAESESDNLLGCLYQSDTLMLFGSRSVEFWPVTTDPNAPFQPAIGRSFKIGMKNTHCATIFDTTFAWVTHKNQVCVSSPDNVISTPAIEEHLNGESSAHLWTFMLEGTEFLALGLDTVAKTYVYSNKSQQWSEFRSYNQTNWVPQCYCKTTSGQQRFGSYLDGGLYTWASDYTEPSISSQIMERTFRAGKSIDGGTLALSNIMLRMNMGQTISSQHGNGYVVNMRTSKDGGQTFGPWIGRSTISGYSNDYRSRVQWRSQGMFSHPGILCEFQSLSNIPFRVSGVTGNESYADVGL